jgi:transcription termination/antitermination protein NusG
MQKQQGTGERHWYAVQTYSGYERAVLRNLNQKVQSEDMGHKIFNVVVPLEKRVKIKGNKRVEVEENIYPGYVLVDMIVDDESWYLVRNTPRVTGVIGAGVTPVPMRQAEIDAIFAKMSQGKVTHTIKINKGDSVVIIDGPFKTMDGKVQEIDDEKGKLKVMVNMFGRETPVELDFLQVKPQ